METINFSEFITPEVQNRRKESSLPPKVQEYDNIKYRRAKSAKAGEDKIVAQFHLSNKMLAEFDVDNHALRNFVHPTDKKIVLVGVVEEKDGKFMKKRENKEKGTAFKSDALEAALVDAGVISLDKVGENQFVEAVKVGENVTIQGVAVKRVYKLTAGAPKPKEESAPKAEAPKAEVKAEAKAAPAPAATAAPAADGSDW